MIMYKHIYIYTPRTQMAHILEGLTHKMESQPPQKEVDRWVIYIYNVCAGNGLADKPEKKNQPRPARCIGAAMPPAWWKMAGQQIKSMESLQQGRATSKFTSFGP